MEHQIENKDVVVMIGDREHDLSAAKNMGIHAVGVLYGFGSYEELQKCAPNHIVHSVEELHSTLLPN
jgi:phosphoglycolate phosphatase